MVGESQVMRECAETRRPGSEPLTGYSDPLFPDEGSDRRAEPTPKALREVYWMHARHRS